MTTNKVTTKWKQNLLFQSDNPVGNTVIIDTKKENGGNGIGLSPKALMLSSLAGCSGFDIISILDKMKVSLSDLEIIVEAELTDTHPKIYKNVIVDYHFYGKNLPKDKINKSVSLSVEKYCGVMEMFRKFAKVETNIHIHKV